MEADLLVVTGRMRRLERTKLDTREFLLYSILQMLTIVGQPNGNQCPFQELRSSMHNSASLFPTRKVWRTGRSSTTHFRSVKKPHAGKKRALSTYVLLLVRQEEEYF